jgi:WD40 repeat protein
VTCVDFPFPVEVSNNKPSWQKRAQLTDSRETVNDVQFAPRHQGLKLATGSMDGFVRIYEAVDVMNLAAWPIVEEFQAAKKDVYCMSWNPSPFDSPMMVVGFESQARIWEFNDQFRRWQRVAELEGHGGIVHDVAWAPNMGRYVLFLRSPALVRFCLYCVCVYVCVCVCVCVSPSFPLPFVVLTLLPSCPPAYSLYFCFNISLSALIT